MGKAKKKAKTKGNSLVVVFYSIFAFSCARNNFVLFFYSISFIANYCGEKGRCRRNKR